MGENEKNEKPQEGKEGQNTENPEVPKEVTFKHRGREVTLPIDKVIDYANQGFDYSQKMEELKRQRDALAAEEQATKLGKDFLTLKEKYPDRAARVAAIANGTDIETGISDGPAAGRQFDTEEMTETEAALYKQNQLLASKLEELSTTVQGLGGMFQQDREEQLKGKLERDIEAAGAEIKEWTPEHVKFFKPQIAELMRSGGMGAREAAYVIAADARKLKDAEARAAKERAEANSRFRTEPPRFGTPRTAEKRNFTEKDLRNGSVLDAAMTSAREFFKNL